MADPYAVVSLTQVDDSGKVQRLRKQCPNCGPGTFMATHFDRVYCGKCATTYLAAEEKAAGGKVGTAKARVHAWGAWWDVGCVHWLYSMARVKRCWEAHPHVLAVKASALCESWGFACKMPVWSKRMY